MTCSRPGNIRHKRRTASGNHKPVGSDILTADPHGFGVDKTSRIPINMDIEFFKKAIVDTVEPAQFRLNCVAQRSPVKLCPPAAPTQAFGIAQVFGDMRLHTSGVFSAHSRDSRRYRPDGQPRQGQPSPPKPPMFSHRLLRPSRRRSQTDHNVAYITPIFYFCARISLYHRSSTKWRFAHACDFLLRQKQSTRRIP